MASDYEELTPSLVTAQALDINREKMSADPTIPPKDAKFINVWVVTAEVITSSVAARSGRADGPIRPPSENKKGLAVRIYLHHQGGRKTFPIKRGDTFVAKSPEMTMYIPFWTLLEVLKPAGK